MSFPLGTFFLKDLYMEREEALPELRKVIDADIKALEKWAGVKNGQWSQEQTQRFHRQVELYMSDSKPGVFPKPRRGERLDPVVHGVLQRMFGKG